MVNLQTTWSNRGAEPFAPHQFETQQEVLSANNLPRIFITPPAYADILTLAQLSGSDEISWLGSVAALPDYQFLIDGIFLLKQKVHSATTEINEEGLADFFTDLIGDDPELAQRVMFWGHVHPRHSTSPSSQDEDQMEAFSHNPWFIRGIFGRSGRAEFTFYDYQRGLKWKDVPWQIHCLLGEELTAKWQAEIDAKVTKQVFTPTKAYGGYQAGWPGRDLSELAEGAGGDHDVDEYILISEDLADKAASRSFLQPRRHKGVPRRIRLISQEPRNVNPRPIIESRVSPPNWPITDNEPLGGTEPQGDECLRRVVKDPYSHFQTAIQSAAENSAAAQEINLGAYLQPTSFEGAD